MSPRPHTLQVFSAVVVDKLDIRRAKASVAQDKDYIMSQIEKMLSVERFNQAGACILGCCAHAFTHLRGQSMWAFIREHAHSLTVRRSLSLQCFVSGLALLWVVLSACVRPGYIL